MTDFEKLLSGFDLHSASQWKEIKHSVKTRKDFDEIFAFLFDADEAVVMFASESIEKITQKNPEYLRYHELEIIDLFEKTQSKELKWQLSLLLPRINMSKEELKRVKAALSDIAMNPSTSKLSRVSALQSLFDLSKKKVESLNEFLKFLPKIEKENIPSLQNCIRHIREEILV